MTSEYTPEFLEHLERRYPKGWQEERYSEDQPRDDHGRFGEGAGTQNHEKLVNTLQSYAGHDSAKAPKILDHAKDAVLSGNESKLSKDPLVAGIRAERVEAPVFRGAIAQANDPILSAKVGQEIQIMPSSFSKNEGTARGYAEGGIRKFDDLEGDARPVSILYRVESGVNGIDVANHITSPKEEYEVITGGKFEVTSVKESSFSLPGMGYNNYIKPTGSFRQLVIGIKQKGVF